MKTSFTSFFGLSGAIALAVSQIPGLSAQGRMWALIASAVSVALLGYYAADQRPRPPMPCALFIALVLGTLAVATCGCRVGGLAVKVVSPAFGSLSLGIGNGAIGTQPSQQTNSMLHAP